jgi:hypothetical protein
MFQRQAAILRESKVQGLLVPTQQFWYHVNKMLKILKILEL